MSTRTLLYPSLFQRTYSVWFRHFRVYTKDFISNAFPPFVEPMVFLVGIGLGLGRFIPEMANTSFLLFLAPALLVTSSMFTAAYECTYGTFIRLEFDKAYDGILAAPISVNNLIIGEILWAGTKGLFFSSAVLIIMTVFQILPFSQCFLAPLAGMSVGLMFACLSILVTSFVKNINYFNFYFTGLLSPMFFFSGVVFPVESLPLAFRLMTELLPLTHVIRLSRALCHLHVPPLMTLIDVTYIVLFILIVGSLAVRQLRTRLID